MIYALCAAGIGGVALSLAFRPTPIDWVAWIAFVPALYCVDRANTARLAASCGCVFGFCFFLFDTGWVYFTLTAHGKFNPALACFLLTAMTAALALAPGCFAVVVWALKQRGVNPAASAPFLWVSQEYLRGELFGGFPWDLCGYSQAARLPLLQIADITGVYGVSFLVIAVNGALWEMTRAAASRRAPDRRLIAGAAALVALTLLYGHDRLAAFPPQSDRGGPCRVGLLQGNIPQEIKWNNKTRDYTFETFERLGADAVRDGARLLLWPETAIPVVLFPGSAGWKRTGDVSQRLGVPMLVGAPFEIRRAGVSSYVNSALLFDGNSVRFRYDKIHLVPFGEYMPLSNILPLGPGIAAREADYTPGKDMTVMTWDGCPPFSVLICYEAIFPELARMAVNKGARLLMNITNDGWFGDTAAPYQHLRMAKLRSVENRVQTLRCANTGISASFDPAGRITHSIPLHAEGFFTVNVEKRSAGSTCYTRFGDVFALMCALITLLMGVTALRDGRGYGGGPRLAWGRRPR
jgi:apolipoprotein N-acyltransferase